MNYIGPKVRLSRKLGVSLTPKADKFLEKKPYPPGMHGFRRRRRLSPYGTQLLEKQRLRFQYNISERQLRNYFRRATRRKGLTGETLLQSLETRLDAPFHVLEPVSRIQPRPDRFATREQGRRAVRFPVLLADSPQRARKRVAQPPAV